MQGAAEKPDGLQYNGFCCRSLYHTFSQFSHI
jgi:hypothetical protein